MSKYSVLPFGCLVYLCTTLALSFDWQGALVLFLFFLMGGILILRQGRGVMIITAFIAVMVSFLLFQQALAAMPQPFAPFRTEFTGYVSAQEIRPNGKQRLTVDVLSREALLKDETLQVYAARYPDIPKGSTVKISCLLETPEPFDGFAYDRYLASQGMYYLCQEAWVDMLKDGVRFSARPLEFLRLWIGRTTAQLWPKPVSSLVLGLLLGTRESFPQQTLNDFQRAGVTHIIALSGFNITILIVFIEAFLIRLLLPKRMRLWVIVCGIILFTVFVGAGASITRAAIMGSLALVAKYSARSSSVLRIMLLTATAMTIFDPFVLAYDLGFQLSFLSTLGLLYLTPLFSFLFRRMPELFSLRESLATTMAATAGTLPLILYQFGQLSVVSPAANMLILPLIPWLMAAGAAAVLLAAISPVLSIPFTILVDQGCQYLLNVSSFAASFSWAAFEIALPSWAFIAACVAVFLTMFYVEKYKEKLA